MQSIPQRVNDFITKGAGAYCDNCIQRELKLARPQQVQQVTSALETTTDFVREEGRCDLCHEEPRMVIHHA